MSSMEHKISEATETIVALINGDFDNPALVRHGPLYTEDRDNIRHILENIFIHQP